MIRFFKHLGKALIIGGLIYFVFMALVGGIFVQLVWPRIQPLISMYQNALSTITNNGLPAKPGQVSPQDMLQNPDFQQMLEQLQPKK